MEAPFHAASEFKGQQRQALQETVAPRQQKAGPRHLKRRFTRSGATQAVKVVHRPSCVAPCCVADHKRHQFWLLAAWDFLHHSPLGAAAHHLGLSDLVPRGNPHGFSSTELVERIRGHVASQGLLVRPQQPMQGDSLPGRQAVSA